LNQRKTSIIGTLGPSTSEPDKMSQLLEAGVNVVRLNFAFGDQKSHAQSLQNLRRVFQQRQEKLAVLLDTKGHSLTTGSLKEGKGVELSAGQ